MTFNLLKFYLFPSAKVLILLIFSIIFGTYFPDYIPYNRFLFVLSIFSSLIFILLRKFLALPILIYYSFFYFYLFIFFLHIFYIQSNLFLKEKDKYKKIYEFYGQVDSFPIIHTKNTKFKDCRETYTHPYLEQNYLVKTNKIKVLIDDEQIWIKKKFYIWVKSKKIEDIKKGMPIYIKNSSYPVKINHFYCGGSKFNYSFYLKSKGIDYTSYLFSNKEIQKIGPIPLYYRIINYIQSTLKEIYKTSLNKTEFALIDAIIFGNRLNIDEAIQKDFIYSGISHVLAISGLHIGMISLSLFIFLSFFQIHKKYIYLFISLFLILYIQLIGWKAPIIRASFLFIYYTLSLFLYREFSFFNSLCLSSIFILILFPFSLYQVDFQFSFLASFGIFFYFNIFYPKINNIFKKNLKKLKTKYTIRSIISKILQIPLSIIVVTFCSQILIFPLLLYHFNGFSIISFLANIPILILTQLGIGLAIILPFVYSISDNLFQFYSHSLGIILNLVIQLAKYFARFQYAYFQISITKLSIFIYYFIHFILIFKYYRPLKSVLYKKKKDLSNLVNL